jgi:hypothetical protein
MVSLIIGVSGFIAYTLKQQQIKHKEKMAMIDKGIYVEARRQESGVPSFGIIILVGIGLAVIFLNQAPFLGFALLFIGVGLIIRDRLLRHKKRVTGRLQTGSLQDEKPKQQETDSEDEPW